MPQEKSFSCSTLRDICLKFVATRIHSLKHNAKELPETVIRDLYEVCRKKPILSNLPSELFVTASTHSLNSFLRFDLPRRKIFNKVCLECKNLRKLIVDDRKPIKLSSEKLSQLFMSIPKIEYIRFGNIWTITDQHLSVIGQHCPLLRHLRIVECTRITGEGIKFLSNTQIEHLEIFASNITPEGCVIALKNLKKLTNLDQHYWDETIGLLQAELDTGGKPVTSYSIESIFLGRYDCEYTYGYNVGKTIAMLFPKLKELYINDPKLHRSFIFLTQKLGKNLTEVSTRDAPLGTIKVIGHFCPMLESLQLKIDTLVVESYDECLETPCDHVPYKRLRRLELGMNIDSYLPRKWLEKLLKNCHLLETLRFECCDRISDDFSFVMQLGNQFRHLNEILFAHCNEFSLSAVQMLLEFLPAVNDVTISNCLDSSDILLLKKYVNDKNWDLSLFDKW